jgi:2-iminobutanoate/2-iminopropanoate deaminase
MKKLYWPMLKRGLLLAGIMTVWTSGSTFAQNKSVDFTKGMPFS